MAEKKQIDNQSTTKPVNKEIEVKTQVFQKENYRAQEAAKYLAVSVSTIWLYRRKKLLPSRKLSPRVTIFKKSDLDRLIK